MNFSGVFSCLLVLLCSTAAFANCPDISGEYQSTSDTEETQTTITYAQTACETLYINAYSVSKFPPFSTIYGMLIAPLNGGLPRQQRFNSPFWGVEGTYQAQSDFILKTYLTPVYDLTHTTADRACKFQSSHLSKDQMGNLIEKPQNVICDDGVSVESTPIVFLKK